MSTLQAENVLSISVTLLGIVGAVVSAVQPLNVSFIFVKFVHPEIFGAVVSDVQPWNVLLIFVTLLGIAGAAVSAVQPLNV